MVEIYTFAPRKISFTTFCALRETKGADILWEKMFI